ncbi:hypothetical protein PCASD_23417 [Puccinia coronata f. sp. avenae]|uniref:Uncharacterized protein n=1 Tax=Puccinia coronata f. sp. avenae TaxID=200324 RepID=A0A2N5TQ08_9BASI|nr:hypothetical protein PCASD_23417 [Puccinia coronata f. sp. avenae]
MADPVQLPPLAVGRTWQRVVMATLTSLIADKIPRITEQHVTYVAVFLAEQLLHTHPNIMLFVAAGSTIAMFVIEKIFQSRRLNAAGILEEEVAALRAAMDTQRAAMDTQRAAMDTQRAAMDTQRAAMDTQRAAMEALAQQHTQLKAQLDTLQAAIKQQTPETRDHIANLGSNSF